MRYLMAAAALFGAGAANAEIIASAPDGFVLKLEAETTANAQDTFTRVQDIASWWESDHTYSGDAQNLSLTGAFAGARWMENWDDGSVEHGRVIARTGTMIRFDAPLGPLAGLGVQTVLTITIADTVVEDTSEDEGATDGAPDTPEGATITFDYVVNGSSLSKLDDWAPIVEGVLLTQLTNLAGE